MTTKNEQEKIKEQPKPLSLWQRINMVRSLVGSVGQDKTVGDGGWSYKVTTHKVILERLRPLMAQYGLVDYVEMVGDIELAETGLSRGKGNRKMLQHRARYMYHVVNADSPDERHSFPVVAFADDADDKGPGKLNTYALKSGQKILLQIGTSDDHEEDRPNDAVPTAAKPATPEQIDALLATADDYYGDDAEKKIAAMCDKVLNIEKISDLLAEHYDAAMAILHKQAKRDGKTLNNDDKEQS